MIRAALLVALALWAAPAPAHQLNVFAYLEAGEVVVETKFSSGRRPVSGEVRVFDGKGRLLSTHALGADGMLRLPLDALDTATGLMIEVETGEGHDDYWILTPEDIARQRGG